MCRCFFPSRRRHTRLQGDWSSDVCSSDLDAVVPFDARQRLGAIAAPTHVIAGEEDIFTPPRFSREIAAAIPESKLTILPRSEERRVGKECRGGRGRPERREKQATKRRGMR